ncbi:alpha/beta fold hydrolase [Gordonia sp. NPDC003429]
MPTLAHTRGSLEYIRYDGHPDRPAVVFLHEGLGSAGQWGRLPALLHQRSQLTTIAYSRHGYGGSSGDGPGNARYLHDEATSVLPDVLASLGVTRPILVGHSDGATIAALYAARFDAAAAVLIAPHVIVEDATLAGIRRTAGTFADKVRPSLAMFHDDPDEVFARWSGVWLSDEFADFDVTADIARIRTPLLVLQGDGDAYASPAQLERIERAATAPVETRLLAGRGHHPHLENPDEICTAILDFVSHSLVEPAPPVSPPRRLSPRRWLSPIRWLSLSKPPPRRSSPVRWLSLSKPPPRWLSLSKPPPRRSSPPRWLSPIRWLSLSKPPTHPKE